VTIKKFSETAQANFRPGSPERVGAARALGQQRVRGLGRPLSVSEGVDDRKEPDPRPNSR